VLLALLDIAGLIGLGTDNAPPAPVAIGAAVLGVVTLAATVLVRRRGALATVIGSRVLSALLGLPVYGAGNPPTWAKIAVGITLVLTAVAVVLLGTGRRSLRPA
jgi:Ca2+/Na+ antiporter